MKLISWTKAIMDLWKEFLEYYCFSLFLIKTQQKWLISISFNTIIIGNKVKLRYLHDYKHSSVLFLDAWIPDHPCKLFQNIMWSAWVLKAHPLTCILEGFEFKVFSIRFPHKRIASHSSFQNTLKENFFFS
jgi:hypothetical protein